MIQNVVMGGGAILAAIYLLGFCWREGHGMARSLAKTGAVAALALAGWLSSAPFLVVLGLGLGALGDYLLSRPGQRAFLAGMAAFAAGHLAYAWYFLSIAAPPLPVAFPGAVIALLLLAASSEFWLAPKTGALRWPVRVYVGVITLMGIAAFAVPSPVIAAGAVLFILSDVLLSLHLFVWPGVRHGWALAILLWIAYWSGQFLILQGAVACDCPA